MKQTRREFLRLGLGSSTLLACGATVPAFVARSASALAADPARAARERVLVVLELNGGNDGLNTVVPYVDDAYRQHRPRLHLSKSQVDRIDNRIALHRALGLSKLLEAGQLAVVQSVGYPNPNRSHFESMAIWQSARLKPAREAAGWLARSLEQRPVAPGGDTPALHISSNLLPQALAGGRHHVPSLADLEQ